MHIYICVCARVILVRVCGKHDWDGLIVGFCVAVFFSRKRKMISRLTRCFGFTWVECDFYQLIFDVTINLF